MYQSRNVFILLLILLSSETIHGNSRAKRLFGGGWKPPKIDIPKPQIPQIIHQIPQVIQQIPQVIQQVPKVIEQEVQPIVNPIKDAVESVVDPIKENLNKIVNPIKDGINKIGNEINNVGKIDIVSIANPKKFYEDTLRNIHKFFDNFNEYVIKKSTKTGENFANEMKKQIEDLKENFPYEIIDNPLFGIYYYRSCVKIFNSESDANTCLNRIFPGPKECLNAIKSTDQRNECVRRVLPGFDECSKSLDSKQNLDKCFFALVPGLKECSEALTDFSKENLKRCAAKLDSANLGLASCANVLIDGAVYGFFDNSVDQDQHLKDTIRCGSVIADIYAPGSGAIITGAYTCRHLIKNAINNEESTKQQIMDCSKEVLNSVQPGLGSSVQVVGDCYDLSENSNPSKIETCATSIVKTALQNNFVSPDISEHLNTYMNAVDTVRKCSKMDVSNPNREELIKCSESISKHVIPEETLLFAKVRECSHLDETSNTNDITDCVKTIVDKINPNLDSSKIENTACEIVKTNSNFDNNFKCGVFLSRNIDTSMEELFTSATYCKSSNLTDRNQSRECSKNIKQNLNLTYDVPLVQRSECENIGNLVDTNTLEKCAETIMNDIVSLYLPYLSEIVKCSQLSLNDSTNITESCLQLIPKLFIPGLFNINTTNVELCLLNNGTIGECVLKAFAQSSEYLNEMKSKIKKYVEQLGQKIVEINNFFQSKVNDLQSLIDKFDKTKNEISSIYVSINQSVTHFSNLTSTIKSNSDLNHIFELFKQQIVETEIIQTNMDKLNLEIISDANLFEENLINYLEEFQNLVKQKQANYSQEVQRIKKELNKAIKHLQKKMLDFISASKTRFDRTIKHINGQTGLLRKEGKRIKTHILDKLSSISTNISSSATNLMNDLLNLKSPSKREIKGVIPKLTSQINIIKRQGNAIRDKILVELSNIINRLKSITMNIDLKISFPY